MTVRASSINGASTERVQVKESHCRCVLELSAELVDAITETVALPEDAAVRAARIYKIVEEVVDAVAWRHGSQPYETERDSLVTLLAAADDHSTRMMQAGTIAATSPTDTIASRCRSVDVSADDRTTTGILSHG